MSTNSESDTGLTPGNHTWWKLMWLVLGSVFIVALVVLVLVWELLRPAVGTLWFEVAKSCLQVIGVAVVGGIVTLSINSWQDERKRAAEAEEAARLQLRKDYEEKRKEDAVEVDRQRELFQLRTSLLDRAAKCAQKMFVVCQHIRRVQKDLAQDASSADGRTISAQAITTTGAEARAMLDEVYLEFSAEAAALDTEIGARYRFREASVPVDAAQQTAEAPATPTDAEPSRTYRHWHVIKDLLTVYYFALCGNFRGNVLKDNSPEIGKHHSGIDFTKLVPRSDNEDGKEVIPTPAEVSAVIKAIRTAFGAAVPDLARSALEEPLIDFLHPDRVPTSTGSVETAQTELGARSPGIRRRFAAWRARSSTPPRSR